MNKLNIEYINIEDLQEYENNAKIHTQEQIEQIKTSIQQFGMNDPIAVWQDNEIIEGHGRLLACRELGIEQVPVIRLDQLTDEQRRAYMIAHNKLTMNTGFSFESLQKELDNFSLDMTDFGFTEAELLELRIDDSDITGKVNDVPHVYYEERNNDIDEEAEERHEQYKRELDMYAQKADNSNLISRRVIIVYQTDEEELFVRKMLNIDDGDILNVVYNAQTLMKVGQ